MGTTDFECRAGLPSAFWKQTSLLTRNLLCSVVICLESKMCFKHSPVCLTRAPMYGHPGTGQRYLSSGSVSVLVGWMMHNRRSGPSNCFSPQAVGCIKGMQNSLGTEAVVEASEDHLRRPMSMFCERQGSAL